MTTTITTAIINNNNKNHLRLKCRQMMLLGLPWLGRLGVVPDRFKLSTFTTRKIALCWKGTDYKRLQWMQWMPESLRSLSSTPASLPQPASFQPWLLWIQHNTQDLSNRARCSVCCSVHRMISWGWGSWGPHNGVYVRRSHCTSLYSRGLNLYTANFRGRRIWGATESPCPLVDFTKWDGFSSWLFCVMGGMPQ